METNGGMILIENHLSVGCDEYGDGLRTSSFIEKLASGVDSELLERWKQSGLSVDLSDQQDKDEDDWRYPFLTE